MLCQFHFKRQLTSREKGGKSSISYDVFNGVTTTWISHFTAVNLGCFENRRSMSLSREMCYHKGERKLWVETVVGCGSKRLELVSSFSSLSSVFSFFFSILEWLLLPFSLSFILKWSCLFLIGLIELYCNKKTINCNNR